MIVVDASVVADFLLGTGSEAGDELAVALEERRTLLAPHLIDAEVGQVLRRYVLRGDIAADVAQLLVDDLVALPIRRQPHGPFMDRAFALRDNATMYDALYLVLAESTEAPFWTGDAGLLDVPNVAVAVRVLETGGRSTSDAAPSRQSPQESADGLVLSDRTTALRPQQRRSNPRGVAEPLPRVANAVSSTSASSRTVHRHTAGRSRSHRTRDDSLFWCFDPDGNAVSVQQWIDVGQHGPDDNLAVDHVGEVVVKTFWYGLVFEVDGGPRIFETHVYGDAYAGCLWTYRTAEEAMRGHAMAVAHLRRLDRSLVEGEEIDGPAPFGMTEAWVARPTKAEVEEWLAALRERGSQDRP